MTIDDEMVDGPDGRTSDEDETRAQLSTLAKWMAVVVLVAFGALAWWMMLNSSGSAEIWQRRVYVYGSVEALVFAAAGAIFATEIKRQEVNRATEQAKKAIEEADEAKRSEQISSERAQGATAAVVTARALASESLQLIEREVGAASGEPGGYERKSAAGGTPSAAASLRALLQVIDELSPPTR
jgi:hypothetical protein